MKNLVLNSFLTLYLTLIAGAYLLGVRPLIVASNSMAPAMSKGDLVMVVKRQKYKVGDIISFKNKGTVATHRIVSVSNNGFRTKGDVNKLIDFGFVQNENLLGKVELIIPLLGFVFIYLQSKYFAYLLLLIVLYLALKKKYVKK